MGWQLERVKKERKKPPKTKPIHTLETGDTKHGCITSKNSEKNETLWQRSGEGTGFATACVDRKAGSDQMKTHILQHEAKGVTSHGSTFCSPISKAEASVLHQYHALGNYGVTLKKFTGIGTQPLFLPTEDRDLIHTLCILNAEIERSSHVPKGTGWLGLGKALFISGTSDGGKNHHILLQFLCLSMQDMFGFFFNPYTWMQIPDQNTHFCL